MDNARSMKPPKHHHSVSSWKIEVKLIRNRQNIKENNQLVLLLKLSEMQNTNNVWRRMSFVF